MKSIHARRRTFAALVLLAVLLLGRASGTSAQTQSSSLTLQKMALLVEGLARFHYQPQRLTQNELARGAQLSFLRNLDPYGIYLQQSDVDALSAFQLNVLRASVPDNGALLDGAALRLRRRLQDARRLAREQAAQVRLSDDGGELDWMSRERPRYAADDDELRRRWRQLLHYRALSRLYYANLPADAAEFQELIARDGAAALRAGLQREESNIQSLLDFRGGVEGYISYLLLNAIASAMDPHSAYWLDDDRRQFEAALSTRAESFGIVLEKTVFGEHRIARLIPGGPAWRSGRLNAGDSILELKFPDEQGRIIQTVDLDPYELQELLNQASRRRIVIVVRKPDSRRLEVALQKAPLQLEENVIFCYVLDGTKRIGYIYLPSFYRDLEGLEAPGAASDVARALIQLKREGIEGVILDLRDNGGGARVEAQDLAGIFLDQGPLFLQRDRDGRLELLKDRNRGAIYSGPLAVMVNARSASASEFFAGVMQDYRRALIVGSRTFGKASSQVVLPMPRSGPIADHLKLTTNMYYGLNGRSHQRRGIQPDFLLPDGSALGGREEQSPAALSAEDIDRRINTAPIASADLSDLIEASEDRVEDDEQFQRIAELSARFQRQFSADLEIPLEGGRFFRELQRFRREFEEYQNASRRRSQGFHSRSPEFAARLEAVDSYRRELHSEQRRQIDEDIYIDETYKILIDALPIFSIRRRP
ncbi:MAG: carboxy terminal-processing peptidase [Leptospirales bacterium]|nr:carboxy terminal-processing peptidase [Leptospirales bacterium]